MIDTRKWRTAVFLIFLLLLGGVLLFCRRTEERSCMGVTILSEAQQADLGRYVKTDLSWDLQYNGQRPAVDLHNSTIYISQNIQPGTKAEDLLGSLRSSPSVRLSFAPDQAFEDLASAVAAGHSFKLNAQYGSDKYMQYDLVFTTLPVLRLDGEAIGKNEKGKDICDGELCLWMGNDPETGRYSVKTSDALWHVRGGISASLLKTPFKVSLKKNSGENRNLSLAGLGEDDDWILNPMNLDDTKLKEKLFMGLWNRRAEQVDWNEKMSDGEYVEVVINQEYWGLFQLQRRIDGKYLQLDTGDILAKCGPSIEPAVVEEAYEIVHTSLTDPQTYEVLQTVFREENGDILDMDNFLDVNLFLQCASAADNYFKNMFLLMEKEGDGYRASLLPWDTDMSWGTVWEAERGGFVYDFEKSRHRVVVRMEYDWMEEFHPDLAQQMAVRWTQLREELLTMETVTEILEQEQQILDASGARSRDTDRWGLYYEGQDSLENLYRSVEARFAWVDEYYSQFLQ